MTKDAEAVNAVLKEYAAAINAHDLNRWLKVFTDDVVNMPPGQPVLKGKVALRAWAKETIFDAASKMKLVPKGSEIQISGDWAFQPGSYVFDFTPKGGGATVSEVGKFINVFQRQPGGAWKYHRVAWNTDKPAPSGDGTPSQADRDGVQKAGDEYIAALNAGDLDRWLKWVTDDIVWLPPDGPPVKGKAAVRAFVKKNFFGEMRYDEKYSIDELEVYGGFAYTLCSIWGHVTPKAGGEKMAFRGTVTSTWRRGPDGAWRVARNMATIDAAPKPPKAPRRKS
jgi:uncharacterized protein (TIGR02246 family)